MKISEFIENAGVFLDFQCEDKHDFLEKAVVTLSNHNDNFDYKDVLNKFLTREETMSTGIGKGIAVPHIIYDRCEKQKLYIFKLDHEIDYNSLDRKPVRLMFVLIGPPSNANLLHLQVLAKLARMMKNEAFLSALKASESEAEIIEIFKRYE